MLEDTNNIITLCGTAAGCPVLSHRAKEQNFYCFPIEVARLSGTTDKINVVVRETLLDEMEITCESRIFVRGEVRSFNNRSGCGPRLIITVFAKEIYFTDEDEVNHVLLRGTICKTPKLRHTPMGRQICDLMLAVNRRYGRSDYLPCIAWGSLAYQAAEYDVGDVIELEGRLQSRCYTKQDGDSVVEKTAFEISAVHIDKV